jgi:hypothetical protein
MISQLGAQARSLFDLLFPFYPNNHRFHALEEPFRKNRIFQAVNARKLLKTEYKY